MTCTVIPFVKSIARAFLRQSQCRKIGTTVVFKINNFHPCKVNGLNNIPCAQSVSLDKWHTVFKSKHTHQNKTKKDKSYARNPIAHTAENGASREVTSGSKGADQWATGRGGVSALLFCRPETFFLLLVGQSHLLNVK